MSMLKAEENRMAVAEKHEKYYKFYKLTDEAAPFSVTGCNWCRSWWTVKHTGPLTNKQGVTHTVIEAMTILKVNFLISMGTFYFTNEILLRSEI